MEAQLQVNESSIKYSCTWTVISRPPSINVSIFSFSFLILSLVVACSLEHIAHSLLLSGFIANICVLFYTMDCRTINITYNNLGNAISF